MSVRVSSPLERKKGKTMEENKTNQEVVEPKNGEETTEEDDNEFLKSLEALDKEEEEKERLAKEEEERIKNKNAEEARKRREAEAKAKKEQEDLKKANKEATEQSAKEQVNELINKYPDIDLGELDKNQDFQEYLEGKWYKGGKSITQIYENFIDFQTRITKGKKEDIEQQYKKKSTPSIKSSGGGGGSDGKDVYTKEELIALTDKIPFMSSTKYAEIEAKLERSVEYHKNKK